MNTATLDHLCSLLGLYDNVGALLSAALKSSAVLALGFALASLLRHRSAAARSAVWRVCFVGLLLIALWQWVPMQTRPVEVQWQMLPTLEPTAAAPSIASTLPLDFVPERQWSRVILHAADAHGLALWLGIAAALLLARIGRASLGRWWLQRHSEPAASSITGLCEALCRELRPLRRPQCRLAQRIGSPVLTGNRRAIIWLPIEAASWDETRLRAVLQHELSHHRRHDILWQWLAVAAACAWWWQPLGWLALHRLRQQTEHAADDLAVLREGNTSSYARALVEIAAGIASPQSARVGVAMFGKGPVQDRVLALLKTNRWRGKIGAGVMALLAIVGLILMMLVVVNVRFTARPPEYISLAKLVAGGRFVSQGSGPQYMEYLQDFYGTIIETLESSEMRRKAVDRVRALNPDLKETDIEIRVTQNKGSAIFNVLAIGGEPKYTREFLNALLDEFRGFRDSIREQQRNKALTALAEDVVTRERIVKEKETKLTEAKTRARKDKKGSAPELAKAESARLIAQLMDLRNRRDAMLQAGRGIALSKVQEALVAPGDIAALEKEIAVVEHNYTESTTQSEDATTQNEEVDRLSRDLEDASRAYHDMFELVRKFQVSEDMAGDAVAIMERATGAVQNVQSPWWIMRWGQQQKAQR